MILSYLLYLILFLLPWQTRWIITSGELNNGPWEYGTLSLYALDVLILLALVMFFCSQQHPLLTHKIFKQNISLGLFILYLIILLPFSLETGLSATKIVVLLLALGLTFLLTHSSLTFTKATLAFLAGSMFSGLLGLWQFFTQQSFASTWLGVALHRADTLGTSVVEAMAPDGLLERWLRAYGSLDHPNMFGGLMAVSLLLTFFLWLHRRQTEKKIISLFLILSLVVFSAGTLVSFSRAAWLSAALGIIILVISYRPVAKHHWKEVMAALVLIVFVKGLIFSQYYYLFLPRLQTNTRLEQISITERQSTFREGLRLLAKQPVQGFGFGTYTLALHDKLDSKKLNWYYQPVHNTFLLLAVETGLVGLALGIWALVSYLLTLYKTILKATRPLLLALTLSLCIIATFDHWLLSLHFSLLFLGTLFGLLGLLRKTPSLTE